MASNPNITSLGTTELGRIIKASSGTIQGTTLQVPTFAYHTSYEKAKIKSIENILDILKTIYI